MEKLTPLLHREGISIIKEIPTDGHTPLKVLGDDYNQYVVKALKNSHDKNSLINEFLGYYFLRLWDIPTPEVAVVSIDPELISQTEGLSVRHKPFLYENICFGSQWIENSIELEAFISLDKFKRELNNPEDFFRLALFDIWIANEDRNPGNNNLLLCPDGEKLITITAIDHAFILASGGYDYLMPEELMFSYNESILHHQACRTLKRKIKADIIWMDKARESFYLCIEECRQHFDEICGYIPDGLEFTPEEQQNIHAFLFSEVRNKKVFEEYSLILSKM
ncbi:HipA family kinase [Marinilabilia salmonicolor]|jgi:hypothetical protein|uniref:HipA-like kinase domain-containing protein n=1 Tax=Marinilabilia salmonicolor TaxID=989 RepID=A0A2T0XH57_9BACT|nr:HipA family kinase [Marinilabilia salmonicolor]PRY98288.1 hypothetical protein BY457_110100 [Marinilabilia salmonicolor]RCW33862.1 hypothetical protein DFO77_11224 [Marinilabilia salmonicolor]